VRNLVPLGTWGCWEPGPARKLAPAKRLGLSQICTGTEPGAEDNLVQRETWGHVVDGEALNLEPCQTWGCWCSMMRQPHFVVTVNKQLK